MTVTDVYEWISDFFSTIIGYAIEALILLWVLNVLWPVLPSLAAFAGFGFLDCLAIIFGIHVAIGLIGKLSRAIFPRKG